MSSITRCSLDGLIGTTTVIRPGADPTGVARSKRRSWTSCRIRAERRDTYRRMRRGLEDQHGVSVQPLLRRAGDPNVSELAERDAHVHEPLARAGFAEQPLVRGRQRPVSASPPTTATSAG